MAKCWIPIPFSQYSEVVSVGFGELVQVGMLKQGIIYGGSVEVHSRREERRASSHTVFLQLLPDLQHLFPLCARNSIRWSSLQRGDIELKAFALFFLGFAIL